MIRESMEVNKTNEIDVPQLEKKDWFARHNFLSRFAGLVAVIVYIAMAVVVLTGGTVSNDFIYYSSLCVIVVFGGTAGYNSIKDVVDIVKKGRK